jgi:EpsI family protein
LLNKELNLKGPIAIRLILAAVIIVATYGALYGLKMGIKPPEVVFPNWCHADNDPAKELKINLPNVLGGWTGEKADLDAKIFNATEAKVAENRNYTDESGRVISLHIAYYDNADAGVWHCPTNCYRGNGFQCREESKVPLEGVSPVQKVLLTRWVREDSDCMVVFWYDLGGATIFDRFDLGFERVKLRGQPTWPPLIKVLIQGRPNAVSQEDRERLLSFSKQVHLWLAEQSHRVGGAPPTSAKPAPEKSTGATESKDPAKAEKSN